MGLHNAHVSGGVLLLCRATTRPLRGELAGSPGRDRAAAHLRRARRGPTYAPSAPGVFAAFALPDEYEYYERYGTDPAVALDHGTIERRLRRRPLWDCFTLVAEVPYFTSAKVADTGPAGITRREAKLRGIEVERRVSALALGPLPEAVAELLTQTSHRGSAACTPTWCASRTICAPSAVRSSASPSSRDEATVAQLLHVALPARADALSHVGQFATMLAAEPERDERLDQPGAEADAKVRARAPHLAAAAAVEPVPIRRLVQAQLAALLCGLDAVRERYRPARPRPASSRHSSP